MKKIIFVLVLFFGVSSVNSFVNASVGSSLAYLITGSHGTNGQPLTPEQEIRKIEAENRKKELEIEKIKARNERFIYESERIDRLNKENPRKKTIINCSLIILLVLLLVCIGVIFTAILHLIVKEFK